MASLSCETLLDHDDGIGLLTDEEERLIQTSSLNNSFSSSAFSSSPVQHLRIISSDSAINESTTVSSSSISDEHPPLAACTMSISAMFQRFVIQSTSVMKVAGIPNLENIAEDLFDSEIQEQWKKTLDFYRTHRQCEDYTRIERELSECFEVFLKDQRKLMIGLDSTSSLQYLLITSIKICSEPEFRIEIRVGLGGTKDLLTLRTPSYAVAPIDLLKRLLLLREKYSATQLPLEDHIPTVLLVNPPTLTFFCAWTAAVKVNNLDPVIGEENALEILSYIEKYIDHFHSNIRDRVQYEMDDHNTYDPTLLNRIIEHYENDYHNTNIKDELIHQAIGRGSNEVGSIRYTSMHLIIFKDVLDKTSSRTLFRSLHNNANEVPSVEEPRIPLYDCIITIGGSVESRFNQVRQSIRKAFMKRSEETNDDRYHFSLSVRFLSKAGKTPVYYHHIPADITVGEVLEGQITNLSCTNKDYAGIKTDLIILKEDIGASLLRTIWEHIPDVNVDSFSSWEDIVDIFTRKCVEVWKLHATEPRSCHCTLNDRTATGQICEHFGLIDLIGSDDDTLLLIKCITSVLEQKIGFPFGQMKSRPRFDSNCERKGTKSMVFSELDHLLGDILMSFVRTEYC